MNAEQGSKHIDDQCRALVAKRKLLLTVEVRTREEAEELLRWLYSDDKPMKAPLLEIAWDKAAGWRTEMHTCSPHRRAAMAEMTLEQVRDWVNNCAISNTLSSDISNEFLGELADAIDAAIKQREQDADVCVWSEDEDGNWDTGCGNMFVLTEGTPYDNEMGFCCYCGHKLDQETQENAAMAKESGNG